MRLGKWIWILDLDHYITKFKCIAFCVETNQSLLGRTGVKEGQPGNIIIQWFLFAILKDIPYNNSHWQNRPLLCLYPMKVYLVIISMVSPGNKRKTKLLRTLPNLWWDHRAHAEPNHLNCDNWLPTTNYKLLTTDYSGLHVTWSPEIRLPTCMQYQNWVFSCDCAKIGFTTPLLNPITC